MGVRDLLAAFNEAAAPGATCQRVLLEYVSEGTTQWQILTFSGNYRDGSAFSIKSNRIRPNGDLFVEVRAAARAVLAQKGAT
jgi:hypothetical protein